MQVSLDLMLSFELCWALKLISLVIRFDNKIVQIDLIADNQTSEIKGKAEPLALDLFVSFFC